MLLSTLLNCICCFSRSQCNLWRPDDLHLTGLSPWGASASRTLAARAALSSWNGGSAGKLPNREGIRADCYWKSSLRKQARWAISQRTSNRPSPCTSCSCPIHRAWASQAWDHEFGSMSSQIDNTYKIDNCHFLACHSGINRIVQRLVSSIVRIKRLNGSWCLQTDFWVEQHPEITMSVQCHKSVSALIWP